MAMSVERTFRRWLPALAMLLLFAAAAERALTVERHCELTKRLLQQYEAEWSDRVAAAERNRGDAKSLGRALDAVAARHRPRRAALYAQYETSEEAAGRFASERKQEIHDYLDAHRDDAADLDAARRRIAALIDRFEKIMEEERRGRR
jgi:hypothetical protein